MTASGKSFNFVVEERIWRRRGDDDLLLLLVGGGDVRACFRAGVANDESSATTASAALRFLLDGGAIQ